MTASNPPDADDIRLTRRRLLGGLAATGVAAAGAGVGTYAYFSDTETARDNDVKSGTLDLKLNGSDGVTGAFSASNLAPGQYGSGTLDVSNGGSIAADHLEMVFSATETEADGPNGTNEGDTAPTSAEGMAEVFRFTDLTYGSTDLLANVSDANSNGIVDLDDVINHGVFDDLAPPGSGGTTLAFTAGIVDTEGSTYTGSRDDDEYQGDELTVTVDFGLAQDAGQDVL